MNVCVTYYLLQTRASGVYVCPFLSPISKLVCEFFNLNPFLEKKMFVGYFRYFIGKRRAFMYMYRES